MPKVKKRGGGVSFAVSPWMSKEDFQIDSEGSPTFHSIVEEPLILPSRPEFSPEPQDPRVNQTDCRAIRTDVGTAPDPSSVDACSHVHAGCIIVVQEDGNLVGTVLPNDGGTKELQSFTGMLLETYRDCTRDTSWNIALLSFQFGDANTHPVVALAEVTGGDELNLTSPVALTDEEIKSISSSLESVPGLNLGLSVNFRCQLLIDMQGRCHEIPQGMDSRFSEPLYSLLQSITASIAHVNIGSIAVVMGR